MDLWLCDLTYTQQSISSDAIPFACGGISTYVKSYGFNSTVIKYPEDLITKLQSLVHLASDQRPRFIGFSNYLWNFNLASAFADLISKQYPDIIIVFGGPNFPIDPNEQKDFLKEHTFIDYYISKEGEDAWLQLLGQPVDLVRAKSSSIADNVPNISFIDEKGLFFFSKVERMRDIRKLPSPYLSGDLDDFLDGRLLPTIQTNRGCPFTCTFCTEGQQVWSLITKKDVDLLKSELNYIHSRIMSLPPTRRRYDLLITDSNFGMYPEDVEIAKHIHALQQETGWPKYINVATGKNNKERVLQVAIC